MINYLELELTSRCNASCSVCPRYLNGELNPNLQTSDITLYDLKNNIEDYIWEQIQTVVLKGTVGDAGSSPELENILHFLDSKNLMISLHTNGETKTNNWWSNIGSGVTNLKTRFCIDGISQDTHYQYRKTNFQKVLSNARSFIDAGGNAEWFYIIFKHNQNEVDIASRLAKDLGFQSFTAIYSDRYDMSDNTQKPDNFHSNLEHVSWSLPTNKSIQWNRNEIKVENFYSNNEIKIDCCPNIRDKSIYIASDGVVWPCCYYGSSNLTKDDLFWKIFKNKAIDNNVSCVNIKHRVLSEILKDPVWEWWNNYVNKYNPKKCQQYCG